MKYALNVCVISCLLFSAGCKHKWDWKPDPYVADYGYQSIINADGKEVLCTDPAFNDFICFTSKNIEELKYNIEMLNLDRKTKALIMEEIDRTLGVK